MIRLEERYSHTATIGGVEYHHIIYDFFNLSVYDWFFPSASGVVGQILDVIDRLLPDVQCIDYCPRLIQQGKTYQLSSDLLPVWTCPENLYLLGANVYAGEFTFDLQNLLLFRVDAIYTRYAPDDSGVTLIPDYDPAQPGYESFLPDKWGGYALIRPTSGQEIVGVGVAHSHRVPNYWHSISLKLLYLWAGAVPNIYHFLHQDNLPSFNVHTTAIPDLYTDMICQGDYYAIAESALINDDAWNFPTPCEWYFASSAHILTVFMQGFPAGTPYKLVYNPLVLSGGGIAPYLLNAPNLAPLLDGGVGGISLSASPFVPFAVWMDEGFGVNGQAIGVRR